MTVKWLDRLDAGNTPLRLTLLDTGRAEVVLAVLVGTYVPTLLLEALDYNLWHQSMVSPIEDFSRLSTARRGAENAATADRLVVDARYEAGEPPLSGVVVVVGVLVVSSSMCHWFPSCG